MIFLLWTWRKEREKGKTLMWGEARDAEGNRVEARQQGPEGYTLTAIAALNIAEKILAGNFTPGFQTPAKAYGPDLIVEIAGTAVPAVLVVGTVDDQIRRALNIFNQIHSHCGQLLLDPSADFLSQLLG